MPYFLLIYELSLRLEMDAKNNEIDDSLLIDCEKLSFDDWINEAVASLDGKPFDKLFSITCENITLKPLYTKSDLQDIEHLQNDFPGFPPFVRGTNSGGYKTKKWLIAQDIRVPSPEDYNIIAKSALGNGQTALILEFNVSLLKSEDESDSLIIENSEMKYVKPNFDDFATYISTTGDLETALKDVNLEEVPLYLKANGYPLMALSMFSAYIKKCGINGSKIKGSIEFDPFMAFMLHGELLASYGNIFKEMAIAMKMAKKYCPNFKIIGINGANYINAGGNAVQELAFSFACSAEYIRQMLKNGFDIDEIASNFHFNFSAGPVFFTEIAKFRAARLIWSKIISEFGGNEESQKLHFSAAITNWNKSNLDAHVNMLRTTSETLSAILGCAEMISTNPYDENIRMPEEFSRRVARNIQNVLLHECNLTEVIDPSGGSYYIESLTEKIATASWELFKKVEKTGGMFESLSQGFPQKEIKVVAAQKIKDLCSRKEFLLGTNKHAIKGEDLQNEYESVPEEVIEQSSIQVLKILERMEQNQDKPELQKLHDDFSSESPELVNSFIEAALAGDTFIEIIDAVRNYDNPAQIEKLEIFRSSEIFENLRFKTDEFRKQFGSAPKVFLASFGTLKQYKARVDFAAEFFNVGGFDSINKGGYSNSGEAVVSFKESDAKVLVICSSDDVYPEVVQQLISLMKNRGVEAYILLAGYPEDKVEAYKSAGVNDFIHVKANIIEVLGKVLKYLGINDGKEGTE